MKNKNPKNVFNIWGFWFKKNLIWGPFYFANKKTPPFLEMKIKGPKIFLAIIIILKQNFFVWVFQKIGKKGLQWCFGEKLGKQIFSFGKALGEKFFLFRVFLNLKLGLENFLEKKNQK